MKNKDPYDIAKYFHWDRTSIREECINFKKQLHIIREIVSAGGCGKCPNLRNRPKVEGCGLSTCLDVIEKIANGQYKL